MKLPYILKYFLHLLLKNLFSIGILAMHYFEVSNKPELLAFQDLKYLISPGIHAWSCFAVLEISSLSLHTCYAVLLNILLGLTYQFLLCSTFKYLVRFDIHAMQQRAPATIQTGTIFLQVPSIARKLATIKSMIVTIKHTTVELCRPE